MFSDYRMARDKEFLLCTLAYSIMLPRIIIYAGVYTLLYLHGASNHDCAGGGFIPTENEETSYWACLVIIK
jgi:hypothetical protein